MVLDTNILIAYLGGDKAATEPVDYWFVNNAVLFISAVTYTEVLALPEASESDLVKIRQFLSNFILIDVDKQIAEGTALLKRKYKLKFPDAAVAATAKYLEVSFVTRDKQLGKVKEITIVKI